MRGIGLWFLQFLFAAATMFLILVGIDLVSGADVQAGLVSAALWAVAAAAIFTIARYNKARKS
jgi:hypothetical protein